MTLMMRTHGRIGDGRSSWADARPDHHVIITRRCADCNAGLQDDDKTHCVECVESRLPPRLRSIPLPQPPHVTEYVKLLRVIARFDWVSTRELEVALGLEEYVDRPEYSANAERNRMMTLLTRVVRRGLVERRGKHGSRDYRVSQAGRDAMAVTP